MNRFQLGSWDLLLITFDALRFDVAESAYHNGRTPNLAQWIGGPWEPRHSPGSFTYSAHAAFFTGFWPTPISPGPHPRPFALRFSGSRSIGRETCVLEGDSIVAGFRSAGYYSVCIGGVGYFNKRNPLGNVFPSLFDQSEWRKEFAVSEVHSAREQVRQAVTSIETASTDSPLFLFINFSATHPPTHFYLDSAIVDSIETQTAALEYVDRQIPALFAAMTRRGRGGCSYLMSDHGTLFGEDGYTGHRVAHSNVWTVPYAESSWEPTS